jgi:hypothetical protein
MPADLVRAVIVVSPSSPASLDCHKLVRTIQPCFQSTRVCGPLDVNTSVHRFQESIAGQPYLFEVAAISQNRWRACMVRIPGVPTALMPFYGPTPAEAADRLRQWLTRAHAHASGRRLSDA